MKEEITMYGNENRENSEALEGFAELVPFEDETRPPFPTHRLPAELGEMVRCLAESTQTPEEMAGLLSLGVLACLYQARFTAEVTPDWREPLCLYCAAVAPPGERKSAVIAALTKPISDLEAERRDLDAPEIERSRAEREILENEFAAAKKAAANDPDRRQRVFELSDRLVEFRPLHEQRWLADDSTPEKLAELM